MRPILTHFYRHIAMRYDAVMKKNHIEKTGLKLLGGMTASQFLREHWQKKPLLIRQAIPGFSGLLSPEELAGLACEDGVESRLISSKEKSWFVEDGPFEESRFLKLPRQDWTLLVQNVNHHLPEADELLRRFGFIPYARLDDLMVSYAPDGGGVGPHFDSYDVFLLQGYGKRLWRISSQQDLSLVEDAPLRILKNFQTEQEWLLEPGDMLYLPPHIAHWGIADGDCMTYSIGFRVPSAQELVSEFLNYLQEKSAAQKTYVDPDLALQEHPAEISASMLGRVSNMLIDLQWNEKDVASFIGRYLSEPKSHVFFEVPGQLAEPVFRRRLQREGIVLDLKSQLLFHEETFFMNGEEATVPVSASESLKQLADIRSLEPGLALEHAIIEKLYEWYLAGFVKFRGEENDDHIGSAET